MIMNDKGTKNQFEAEAIIGSAIIPAAATIASTILANEIGRANSTNPVSVVVENNLDADLNLQGPSDPLGTNGQGEPIHGDWQSGEAPPEKIEKAPTYNNLLKIWVDEGIAPISAKDASNVEELSDSDKEELQKWVNSKGDEIFNNVRGFGIKSKGFFGSSGVALYKLNYGNVVYNLAFAVKRTSSGIGRAGQRCAFALWKGGDKNHKLSEFVSDSPKKMNKLSDYITDHCSETKGDESESKPADGVYGYTNSSRYTAKLGNIRITVQGAEKSAHYILKIEN